MCAWRRIDRRNSCVFYLQLRRLSNEPNPRSFEKRASPSSFLYMGYGVDNPTVEADVDSILAPIISEDNAYWNHWRQRGLTENYLKQLKAGCTHWSDVRSELIRLKRERDLSSAHTSKRTDVSWQSAKRRLADLDTFVVSALRLPNRLVDAVALRADPQHHATSATSAVHSSYASDRFESTATHKSHVDILKSLNALDFASNGAPFLVGESVVSRIFAVKKHVTELVQRRFGSGCLLFSPSHFVRPAIFEACYPAADDFRRLSGDEATRTEQRPSANRIEVSAENFKLPASAHSLRLISDPLTPLVAAVTRRMLSSNTEFPLTLFAPHLTIYDHALVDAPGSVKSETQFSLYSSSQKNVASFLTLSINATGLERDFVETSPKWLTQLAEAFDDGRLAYRVLRSDVNSLRPVEMGRFDLEIHSPWLRGFVKVAECSHIGDYLSSRLHIKHQNKLHDADSVNPETKRFSFLDLSAGHVNCTKLFAVLLDNFGVDFLTCNSDSCFD